MRAQQAAGPALVGIDPERIVHGARRMVRRKIQRLEVVPVVFDLGTIGELVTKAREDPGDAVEGTRDRMQASAFGAPARQGHVDALCGETSIEFDDEASATSTLLQVVAQDVAGLLRAISVTLSRLRYNVEVALVDTEGETAIDVFYLTQNGNRLTAEQKRELRVALLAAIEENAE